jgi:hypothetical protein
LHNSEQIGLDRPGFEPAPSSCLILSKQLEPNALTCSATTPLDAKVDKEFTLHNFTIVAILKTQTTQIGFTAIYLDQPGWPGLHPESPNCSLIFGSKVSSAEDRILPDLNLGKNKNDRQ